MQNDLFSFFILFPLRETNGTLLLSPKDVTGERLP